MTNKELFTKIYKDNIKREGAVALLEYINMRFTCFNINYIYFTCKIC